jgi:L-fuconolactonase
VEIIDAQVHLNMVGLEAGLAAMDAVGVDAVVIDEYLSPNPQGLPQSGSFFSDTGFRYTTPMSEEAVRLHPERFVYLARCSPDDPELEQTIGGLRDHPGRVALRVIPHLPVRPGSPAAAAAPSVPAPAALRAAIRDGGYDAFFSAAERAGVPVFLQLSGNGLPGDLDLFEQVARGHPGLQLVVDHMGVSLPAAPGDDRETGLAGLVELERLAGLPNVTLKWCHMIRLSGRPFPYDDIAAHLHRLVGIFGADRIMWASDWTIDLAWASWADALFSVRDDDALTLEERALILGGTVRRVLDWQRRDADGGHGQLPIA